MRQLSVTLYAHNLKEPYRSFDETLKMKDFKVPDWLLDEANKVTYRSPNGSVLILKDKKRNEAA